MAIANCAAFVGESNAVTALQSKSGRQIWTLGARCAVSCLAVLPAGNSVLAGLKDDNHICAWDVSSTKLLWQTTINDASVCKDKPEPVEVVLPSNLRNPEREDDCKLRRISMPAAEYVFLRFCGTRSAGYVGINELKLLTHSDAWNSIPCRVVQADGSDFAPIRAVAVDPSSGVVVAAEGRGLEWWTVSKGRTCSTAIRLSYLLTLP